MAIALWPCRTPVLEASATQPRWRRLRRGSGLARLRTRGEIARPVVLFVAFVVPLAVLWQESGPQMTALFAGTMPRATHAVTTLVAAWTPAHVDVRQAPASRPLPTDRSPAASLAQEYSARMAAAAGDQTADAIAASPAANLSALDSAAVATSGDAAVPTPDAYVAVLASVEVAAPATDGRTRADPAAPAAAGVPAETVARQIATPASPGGLSSAAAARSQPRTHVVVAGESLSSIASRYDVSVADLVRMNGLADPDKIVEGDRLTLSR